jgi:hypothetical protein
MELIPKEPNLINSPLMLSLSLPLATRHLQCRTFTTRTERIKARLTSLKQAQTPPKTIPLPTRKGPPTSPTPAHILRHREAMKAAFPDGWNPPRKLSREAMEGLRTLHAHDPAQYTTPVLASRFKVSPEAVRRILKSKWQPSDERKKELLVREQKVLTELRAERRMKEWDEAKRALRSSGEGGNRQGNGQKDQSQDGFELT